jgi:hypothetical protein
MSGAHSQWLLTTVNAVREVMIGRFTVRAVPLGKSGVGGLCWLIRPLD